MRKLLFFVLPAAMLSLLSFQCSSTTDHSAPDHLPSGAGHWAPFGSYQKGDSIIYLAGTEWRPGSILETGKPFNPSSKNGEVSELQYKVAEGGGLNWPDWKDFSQVVAPRRENWWTDFFTGEWNLGEGMAVNTNREGNEERTEFNYQKATEALVISGDGSYTWKTDGQTITGKWKPKDNGPGIILQSAYRGMNWTFINQTNAVTMHIRQLENGRLIPDGTEMSKSATRPMK